MDLKLNAEKLLVRRGISLTVPRCSGVFRHTSPWPCRAIAVSWRERQIDKILDRHDPGIAELPQAEQILVLTDYDIRFGGCSAFENAVVGGILFNDVQGFGET
jgi:hypothetical protein